MFGRGNWAVFGIESASMGEFQKTLADPFTSFKGSQLAASIASKFQNEESIGINPFGNPRLDEKLADAGVISDLSDMLKEINESDTAPTSDALEFIQDNLLYIGSEPDLSLGNNKYGLWFVQNSPKDPTDPNSKREQLAYEQIERPFKFLTKEEKKTVEDQVTAQGVLNRSQFPVLIDFQNERVYAQSSNKDEVVAIRELLKKMGAKTFDLMWDFGNSTWPSDFLNKVTENTHFDAAFKERADQLARFAPDQIEKLDDKQIEKIVSTFFSLSPLESELWCGLTTPARVRIHKPIDPAGVSNPSVAYSLLHMSNDAEIASASVVFQELVSKMTKNGERVYRNDLFTIDINDNVNLSDAGAALICGFDLPQFKKEVKIALKAKGRIEIRDFWYMWLDGIHNSILQFIDNVTDVLELDKTNRGLVVPDFGGDSEVTVTEE